MLKMSELVIELEGLKEEDLRNWISSGWVRPVAGEDDYLFSDADRARVLLIADLRERMGINDEAMPVILDLIDQIHGLRHELKRVLEAVNKQAEPVRSQILDELKIETSTVEATILRSEEG